jgi:hypothetical protein
MFIFITGLLNANDAHSLNANFIDEPNNTFGKIIDREDVESKPLPQTCKNF